MTSLATLAHTVPAPPALQWPVLRHRRHHHPGPVPRHRRPGPRI